MAIINEHQVEHIGDGVYVWDYKGGGIGICANHHSNEQVFLEPSVIINLKIFLKAHNPEMLKLLQDD